MKLADLHKACQTSRGGVANAQLPPPSGCATVWTWYEYVSLLLLLNLFGCYLFVNSY